MEERCHLSLDLYGIDQMDLYFLYFISVLYQSVQLFYHQFPSLIGIKSFGEQISIEESIGLCQSASRCSATPITTGPVVDM